MLEVLGFYILPPNAEYRHNTAIKMFVTPSSPIFLMVVSVASDLGVSGKKQERSHLIGPDVGIWH